MYSKILIALFLSTFLGSPLLACEMPKHVKLPNSKKATDAEMRVASERVHDYLLAMQTYQECEASEASIKRSKLRGKSSNEKLSVEQSLISKHNAAHRKMIQTIEEFNTLISEFRSR